MHTILLRHAKSTKNLESRHGGHGGPILVDGLEQIQGFIKRIEPISPQLDGIRFAPRLQCQQTAIHVASAMGLSAEEDTRLEPISLGTVDGLSDREVQDRFPKLAKQLDRWRASEIEINELYVPGATPAMEFFDHGQNYVKELIAESQSFIIVATRSILVLLAHVLLGNSIEKGGNYREIKWNNCGCLSFLTNEQNTVHLPAFSTVMPPDPRG